MNYLYNLRLNVINEKYNIFKFNKLLSKLMKLPLYYKFIMISLLSHWFLILSTSVHY